MDILPILSTLRRHKVTAFLVIIEIALTCAIVCNAVFLINQRLDRMHMTSGVAEHELLEILFADIGPNKNQKARTEEDLAALRQIPGVLQVSSANQVPFGNSSWNGGIKLDRNQRVSTLNATTYTGENVLQTLGTQMVEGRNLQPDDYMDFDDVVRAASVKDAKGIPKVTVITQNLAQRLWPGQQPLGKVIYYADYPMTVVGVVKHLVRPSFTDNATSEFTMVLPMRITQGLYIIRTDPQNRDAVLKAAVAKMKAINPHRVILKQRPWDEVRSNFFQNDRAMAGLLVGVMRRPAGGDGAGHRGPGQLLGGAASPADRRAASAGRDAQEHPALLPDREFPARHHRYRAGHGARLRHQPDADAALRVASPAGDLLPGWRAVFVGNRPAGRARPRLAGGGRAPGGGDAVGVVECRRPRRAALRGDRDVWLLS